MGGHSTHIPDAFLDHLNALHWRIKDYANKAKEGDKRHNMVLFSNAHRSKIPEFKKNEMENEL